MYVTIYIEISNNYIYFILQLFDDQDTDKDLQLSLKEWTDGGGYLT